MSDTKQQPVYHEAGHVILDTNVLLIIDEARGLSPELLRQLVVSFESVANLRRGPLSFKKALALWEQNKTNGDEGFWQKLFSSNPKLLAQVVPSSVIQIAEKCYMGGKDITNHGGNLLDFLYATKFTTNAFLVEIKTPTTPLLGSQYRTNAYAISSELSGSVVQVLTYKDELMKNYYNLIGRNPDVQFTAFNPQCLVIAGSFHSEPMDAKQRRSLDLFRSSIGGVQVLTYDELFERITDLVSLVEG